MKSLLAPIITSNTRIRILMRLFLNPDGKAYLRELADDFAMSPSQVKGELDQLSQAGLLISSRNGRQIDFRANRSHPLYPELHSMVRKALGMDHVLDSIVQRLGRLELALLLGDYAVGKDTGIIDLALVGEVDQVNLTDLISKTERHIGRKIRTLVLSGDEYQRLRPALEQRPVLTLWERGQGLSGQQPNASDAQSLDNVRTECGGGSCDAE